MAMAIETTARPAVRGRLAGAAFAAVVILLALAAPAGAGVTTFHFVDNDATVGPNGCDDVGVTVPTQIQDAIDVAVEGDRILVCNGDYERFSIVDDAPNDLIVRSVNPWKARIIAPPDFDDDELVLVEDTRLVTIKWFTLLTKTAGCTRTEPIDSLIDVQDAPGTQIRSNHLGVIGTDTIGNCGYLRGINVRDVEGPGGVAIAWNRVVDFMFQGIRVDSSPEFCCDEVGFADIIGNTLRYFHRNEAVDANEDGATGIRVLFSEGAKVARNWVRGIPSGGDTTPRLTTGIGMSLAVTVRLRIFKNHVLNAERGINLIDNSVGATIRDNRIRGSSEDGIRIQNVRNALIEDNLVTGGAGSGFRAEDNPIVDTTFGNTIRDNDFRGNAGIDCVDDTIPTDNTWIAATNLGNDANQAGLCTPGTVETIN